MKKLIVLIVLAIGVIIGVTGCDPEKTGGGGKPQAYDSNTGKYK